MPWRLSRMSWSSKLFRKQTKILCFCNHNYLTCYNPQEWTQPCGAPTGHNKRDAGIQHVWQVLGRGGVWWGDDDNTVWPHILQNRVQLQIQKSRSGHPRSTNILSLYAYLINLPLPAIASFFPTHSSSHHIIPSPASTSHPLRFLHNKTPMSLLQETKGYSRNSRSSQRSWNCCDTVEDGPAQTALRWKGKS